MNVSEIALIAGISHLEVDNDTAFNTPTTGTPIPASKMSSETLAILQEASNKLKEADKGPTKGTKRKRTGSPSTERQSTSRDRYPPESKPLYLKSKNLHRKKLSVATNIHSIKAHLKEGKFPASCNFKCTPPVSVNESFKTKWAEIVNKCKRDLTLHLVEELNSKYTMIKADIQTTYAELENITNTTQFKELKDSLTGKYKAAAATSMQRRLQPESKPKFKPRGRQRQNRQNPPNRQRQANKQLQFLIKGLNKLVRN